MTSAGVVCRAYDAEAPYVKSFINHYRKLGCSEFHIVVPKGNSFAFLAREVAGIDGVHLHVDHEISHFNEAQNVALEHVTTSHVLWVDIDEYLAVESIVDLLHHDYLEFPWTIAPFNPVAGSTSTWGFEDAQVKYLVRTSACRELRIHDCVVSGQISRVRSSERLVHHVYRSYADLFLKCTLGNYQSYQLTKADQLRAGALDCTALPLKYKMAAIYQRLAHSGNLRVPFFCQVDVGLECSLVESTPYADLYIPLHESLMRYQSRIALEPMLEEIRAHPKYLEFGRLPHFVLSEIADTTLSPEFSGREFIGNRGPSVLNAIRRALGLFR